MTKNPHLEIEAKLKDAEKALRDAILMCDYISAHAIGNQARFARNSVVQAIVKNNEVYLDWCAKENEDAR